MEWLWYYLLTSDATPCPTSDSVSETTRTRTTTTSTDRNNNNQAEITSSSSVSMNSIMSKTKDHIIPNIGSKAFEWASRLPYYEHFDFPTRVKLANISLSTFIAGIDDVLIIPKKKKKKLRRTFLRNLFHIT